MPFFSAISLLFWMTGPSAMGSEKGIPISIISAPALDRALIIPAVESSVGCPAVKYIERIFPGLL